MSNYTLTLSTTEPNNLVGLLKFRQGDKNSQVLNVTVTENGKLFKFDGLAVFFNSVLPNGTVVRDKVQTIDYANSKLTYKVIDSFLQEVAAISAWFSFENGTKVVDSTKNFRYLVEAGWQSCIIQGNYIYELSEIQREIEEIIGNKDFSTVINKIDYLETGIAFLDNTKTSKDEFEAKTSLLDNIKISKDEFEAKTSVQDSKIQTLMSNGPKGVYATLSNLVTALPSGDTGIYITSDDGHWRYWNGSWVDGGIYQSNMPSPNGSVAFVYGNTTEGMIWDLTEKRLYWTDEQYINYQTTGWSIPPDTIVITSPQFIVFDTVDKKIKAVGNEYSGGMSKTRILLCYLNPDYLAVSYNAAIGRLTVDDGVNKRDLNELINYSTKIPKNKFTAIVYGARIIGEMNWDRSNEKLSWSNCYVMIGDRAFTVPSGEVAVTNQRVVVFDTNLETFVNIGEHYLQMNENQAFVCSLLTNLDEVVTCSISKFRIDAKPYINGLAISSISGSISGKKYACFGDSITSDQVSGVGTLVANDLQLDLQANFAVGWSTMQDWQDGGANVTVETLTHQQNEMVNTNVLSNQVLRAIQSTTSNGQQLTWTHPIDGNFSIDTSVGVGTGTLIVPDVIYIASSTNDGENINTPIVDNTDTVLAQNYSQLDKISIASALRWSIETFQSAYPNAQIFVASPIQTNCDNSWMSFSNNKIKRDIIAKVCQFTSVNFIDSFNASGFSKLSATSGILTADGIHPNATGKNRLVSYVGSEMKHKYLDI